MQESLARFSSFRINFLFSDINYLVEIVSSVKRINDGE